VADVTLFSNYRGSQEDATVILRFFTRSNCRGLARARDNVGVASRRDVNNARRHSFLVSCTWSREASCTQLISHTLISDTLAQSASIRNGESRSVCGVSGERESSTRVYLNLPCKRLRACVPACGLSRGKRNFTVKMSRQVQSRLVNHATPLASRRDYLR